MGIANPPYANGLPATAFLDWGFQLVVPISKLKDTTAALTTLEKSISQNSVLTLEFTMRGTLVSVRFCVWLRAYMRRATGILSKGRSEFLFSCMRVACRKQRSWAFTSPHRFC